MHPLEAELAEELGGQAARPAKVVKKTPKRLKVSARCQWRCHWCQQNLREKMGWQNSATIEHVVPKSHGGTGEIWNLVAACHRCNFSRGIIEQEVFAMLARGFKPDTRLVLEACNSLRNARNREREQQRQQARRAREIQPLSIADRLRLTWFRLATWAPIIPV